MTGVDSERVLIDDRGDLLYGYTFSALRQDLRFRHVLDRATLEGQKRHVYTRFCPFNLVMGRHLLRTVRCRGDENCGYHTILNGICHLSGQVRTNTVVSASIWCVALSIVQQYRWFRGVRGEVRSNQVVLTDINNGRRPIILTTKLHTVTQH